MLWDAGVLLVDGPRLGLRLDLVRANVLALPPLRSGPVPVNALGLVVVFVAVLLSPLLFDAAALVAAR